MAKLLTNWTPENTTFWEKEGRQIARRNLWISIPALLLAFVIWQIWSVAVVNLPNIGFKYTPNQLFWLAAIPALSGATLRIFYSFVIPIFGGRRWTAISTLSLLIPAIGLGICVQDPHTSFTKMLILALLCGFGGGNFSSSMSNISFFFPKAEKGSALGLNAGLGNLGVSVVQLVVPLIITVGLFGTFGGAAQEYVSLSGESKQIWLQNAGFIWVPFIVFSATLAWFGMNDISSMNASFKTQAIIFKRKHNWLMCWLYVGTFGSFIGFSAGFPLLIKGQFPDINPMQYAFLGPLIGAIFRVLGGMLSDKIAAAKITQWSFIAMIVAVFGVLYFLPASSAAANVENSGNFGGFLICFLTLFALSGVGNGSTFAQIPLVFSLFHRRIAGANAHPQTDAQTQTEAGKESAAVLGFSGAIGAFGGFLVPKSYGTSIELTGGVEAALYGFIIFYITCIAINWWYYARANAILYSQQI